MTSAIDPAAPEIIAGRPPVNAVVTATAKDAKRPSRGSTPATLENEIASGISASATTRPPKTSLRSRTGEENANLNESITPTGASGSAFGCGLFCLTTPPWATPSALFVIDGLPDRDNGDDPPQP